MLPSFARLRLSERATIPAPVRRSATTGEFFALSEAEAADKNAETNGDPISFEDFEPNADRSHPSATFRVRNRDPQPDGTYKYTWYKAANLWRWAKNNSKQPLTNEPIWKEDWWALCDRYDAGMRAPAWVKQLPQLDPDRADNRDYEEPEEEEEEWAQELDAADNLQFYFEEIQEAWAFPGPANGPHLQTHVRTMLERVSDNEDYAYDLVSHIASRGLSIWNILVNESVGREYELPIKASLVHLLAELAIDFEDVRVLLREHRRPPHSIMAAIYKFLDQLEEAAGDAPDVLHHNRDWLSAKRVLHYMKWDEPISDDALRPPQHRVEWKAAAETLVMTRALRQRVDDAHMEINRLTNRLKELTTQLDQGGVQALMVATDRHIGHQNALDELAALFRSTRGTPRRVVRRDEAVQLWLLMLNLIIFHGEDRESPVDEAESRFLSILYKLIEVVWLAASHTDPDVAWAADTQEMRDFFWHYVAPWYELAPYNQLVVPEVEWANGFAIKIWGDLRRRSRTSLFPTDVFSVPRE